MIEKPVTMQKVLNSITKFKTKNVQIMLVKLRV